MAKNNLTSLGIDPGLHGAIALITLGNHAMLWNIPTVVSQGKRRYQVASLVQILKHCKQYDPIAILEAQHPMPKQGAVSGGRLMHGLGLLEGILATLGIAYTLVAPTHWKRDMLADMAKDKGASIVRAQQLFPECVDDLQKASDHNKAEALLLAKWGLR